jgi:fructokinase
LPEVITIGEALIDFTSLAAGVSLPEATTFEKTAGGAPLNVAVGLARLGLPSGFVGRVGNDPFGHFVADTLVTEGVDASHLGFENKARTGLAFASLTPAGERDSVFVYHPNASALLSPGHINPGYIKGSRAVVFDSTGLVAEPCRSGVLKALAIARNAGVLCIFDVNLHLSRWGSEAEALYGLRLGLDRADIVKLNVDEMVFLTGTQDPTDGIEKLWTANSTQRHKWHLLVVTCGAQGCAYQTATQAGKLPGYHVNTIDSTGAGDGFLAGMLTELLSTDLSFEREAIERALRLANAAGALTTTQRGAAPSLPTRTQVDALLNGTQ